jgi:alkanesulfonate monooxygenase SsuD/methylene tetrahydromethanopterin reductase-like flavin-dependent oxidoreductase (luciferase family)
LKLRDLYNEIAVARGYPVACGSPATVADLMEEWFKDGAVDGFMLLPAHFREAFDDFIDLVIPELQRRCLFRKDYRGTMLRDHLGLPKPQNRFARAP